MARIELCYENYENCGNLQRFNENYKNSEYLQISHRAATRMTKITKTAHIFKYRIGPQREFTKITRIYQKGIKLLEGPNEKYENYESYENCEYLQISQRAPTRITKITRIYQKGIKSRRGPNENYENYENYENLPERHKNS